ncbi:ABC transporter permease [Microbispora bryophytorum]|uniref:Peptide ABC transporter permease n=2 Tax=Microbispora bryophytorum TaxID=1460882 RepID=A0A8H9GUR8_9ACTN|nr:MULTISPECIES: ABC transporter permease [Microbispora]MBD3138679.1 ABC transporter permease [Microbispora bryophytorum]MBD3145686.1 ABC transporter permease [Microbispora camponoti]TQS03701.1 ABC transporter permease [Microbispora bryophytorum]GGO02043.1 peptide ABC transporter permease [Microbispora bryophytorum]
MRRYFGRKLLIYGLTFFVAVTINWMIPRFMPGDPVQSMLSRANVAQPAAVEAMRAHYTAMFGFDLPLWQQYLNFWGSLLKGDLGISIWLFPTPVSDVIIRAVPYTLGLLIPSILLSWFAGNRFGAFAARRKWLDNTVLPVGYVLTATPYMWLAILLAWALGIVAGVFPVAGAYGFDLRPSLSWEFLGSLAQHWFLPFASLFLVAFGGWAIGMRNMIIYELEADYVDYLRALGAPARLVRRYAFRNAILPQVTGLALQLGVLVAGALVTEIVFSYPGLGHLILQAIQNQDFFLLQGTFLFIVIGVLIANFVIDIAYVLVDPRTRTGMGGAA